VQIDPNSQAPVSSTTMSDSVNAPLPIPSAGKRRGKKERKVQKSVAEIADVEQHVAEGASSVLESTDLEAVTRRLRSGAYNTREVAEVIARRLLASGDL
jgi:hypothetical protein